MTIPYREFLSLSPILHQICSSDFVSQRWISIMKSSGTRWVPFDWRNKAPFQFQLLSDLCQSTNKTIDDAVRRFNEQSFITSSVLNEIDFNIQLNATLEQFFQSTVINFGVFTDTVRLLMQVDQYYMGSAGDFAGDFDTKPIIKIVTNELNNQQSLQVCLYSKQYNVSFSF